MNRSTAKVAIIGDSLTYMNGTGEALIKGRLNAAGIASSRIYWYGVTGKRINQTDDAGKKTEDNIADARAALGEPDVWVIALGTNGRGDTPSWMLGVIQTVLALIGPSRRVIWVGVGLQNASDANTASTNTQIQTAVDGYALASYANWNAHIHNGRDETGMWAGDGIHMSPSGYAVRLDLYEAQILAAVDALPDPSAPPDKSARLFRVRVRATVPASNSIRLYSARITATLPILDTIRLYDVFVTAEVRRHFVRQNGEWYQVQMFVRKGGQWK